MILNTSKFELPKFFLFNAAAAVMGVATVTWIVRDALFPETEQPCSTRYEQAMVFGFSNGGQPLSAADLQARLGGRDWGLVENTSIVGIENGPASLALKVALPKSAADGPDKSSGMGFSWTPQQIQSATSACLSYSIRLPKDFEFGNGGALPGLYGGIDPAPDAANGFSVRGRWRDNGLADFRAVTSEHPQGGVLALDQGSEALKRDRWVRIDQEVVLNQPGKSDGVMRVWIDDALALDRTGVAIRKIGTGFAGITADLHYSRGDLSWAPSPKSSSVLLSPLELRWK